MRDLIRKLAENHTVILSSHILTEIREVCDYILIISKGKLVAQDTLENLEKMIGFHDVIELETSASEESRSLCDADACERRKVYLCTGKSDWR